MGDNISKCSQLCLSQYVLTKACADTSLVTCLAEIRSVDEIAYQETILSILCLQIIVARGNVVNFFYAKERGLFIKRYGL
jgi:hypothetical protein